MILPLPVGIKNSRQNRLPVKADSGGLYFPVAVKAYSGLYRAFIHGCGGQDFFSAPHGLETILPCARDLAMVPTAGPLCRFAPATRPNGSGRVEDVLRLTKESTWDVSDVRFWRFV
jgi:hypothetical protein